MGNEIYLEALTNRIMSLLNHKYIGFYFPYFGGLVDRLFKNSLYITDQ